MATRRTLIGNIKGPKGDTGETGATGATGAAGQAATIQVGTVSTTAYGNTAQVTNTGTAQDAVFDFVIPQGRPGEETTTMSTLTLDTVTAQSSDFPVPATGESGSTVFGKIIKFFNDVKSNLLKKSDCVTVLTSTDNDKPLAASAGKTLNDALAAQAVFTPVAPSEWTGNWDNVYSQPLTIYRFVVMTAEYNGQVMVQQMYPSAMLSGKSMYLAYQDPSWNGRVKFMFNNELTRCTVSNFTNFTKVKLFGIK